MRRRHRAGRSRARVRASAIAESRSPSSACVYARTIERIDALGVGRERQVGGLSGLRGHAQLEQLVGPLDVRGDLAPERRPTRRAGGTRRSGGGGTARCGARRAARAFSARRRGRGGAFCARWRLASTSVEGHVPPGTRLAVEEHPVDLDDLEAVRDRGEGLGVADEQVAPGIERLEEVVDHAARGLELEVDGDVAAEDDVPVAQKSQRVRLLDQVVIREVDHVAHAPVRACALPERVRTTSVRCAAEGPPATWRDRPPLVPDRAPASKRRSRAPPASVPATPAASPEATSRSCRAPRPSSSPQTTHETVRLILDFSSKISGTTVSRSASNWLEKRKNDVSLMVTRFMSSLNSPSSCLSSAKYSA